MVKEVPKFSAKEKILRIILQLLEEKKMDQDRDGRENFQKMVGSLFRKNINGAIPKLDQTYGATETHFPLKLPYKCADR